MTETAALSLEELRRFDLFDEISDDELRRWAAVAQVSDAPAGEIIASPDDPVRGLILL
ncbi:MAG: hypothetical protein QOK19_878, partial [Solirubrobacteraceae bacterium]|nr:hypothetical protein [Solirubrobacteraceae bacterium]